MSIKNMPNFADREALRQKRSAISRMIGEPEEIEPIKNTSTKVEHVDDEEPKQAIVQKKKVQQAYYMTQEQVDALDYIKFKEKRDKSEVVRAALDMYLEKHLKELE